MSSNYDNTPANLPTSSTGQPTYTEQAASGLKSVIDTAASYITPKEQATYDQANSLGQQATNTVHQASNQAGNVAHKAADNLTAPRGSTIDNATSQGLAGSGSSTLSSENLPVVGGGSIPIVADGISEVPAGYKLQHTAVLVKETHVVETPPVVETSHEGEEHVKNITSGLAGMILTAPAAALESIAPVLSTHLHNASSTVQAHASNLSTTVQQQVNNAQQQVPSTEDVQHQAQKAQVHAESYLEQAKEGLHNLVARAEEFLHGTSTTATENVTKEEETAVTLPKSDTSGVATDKDGEVAPAIQFGESDKELAQPKAEVLHTSPEGSDKTLAQDIVETAHARTNSLSQDASSKLSSVSQDATDKLNSVSQDSANKLSSLADSAKLSQGEKENASKIPDANKTYTQIATDTVKGKVNDAAEYVQPSSERSHGQSSFAPSSTNTSSGNVLGSNDFSRQAPSSSADQFAASSNSGAGFTAEPLYNAQSSFAPTLPNSSGLAENVLSNKNFQQRDQASASTIGSANVIPSYQK